MPAAADDGNTLGASLPDSRLAMVTFPLGTVRTKAMLAFPLTGVVRSNLTQPRPLMPLLDATTVFENRGFFRLRPRSDQFAVAG